MVAALAYLQLCSWRNLVLAQARRLRKPQYLLGLLAGLAYFGFLVLQPFGSGRRGTPGQAGGGTPSGFVQFGPTGTRVAAAGLFLLAALTWLVPSKRAALDFSEAEIAWLFPAPIPRRLLVHFRLLKTQVGLVFSALVIVLITTGLARGRFQASALVGWWILMSALELHRQAAGFTRTRLLDRGVPNWARRGIVLVVLLAVVGLAWASVRPHLPELTADAPVDSERMTAVVSEVLGAGIVGTILWPFRTLIQPLAAQEPTSLALAALPAFGLLALLYLWALTTAVGFEDESLVRAERRTRLLEAARAGNWHLAREQGNEGRPPFPLPPRGPRLIALTWKNLISAQSVLASPFLLAVGISLLVGLIVFRFAMPEAQFLKVLAGMIAGLAPMVFLVGPELARFDLRQSLPQADILKTFPLAGWQVVLGELLAPVLALTLLQWLMLAAGLIGLPEIGRPGALSLEARGSIALTALALVPTVNLTMVLLHNATALIFPAWVRLGPGGAQGFEAMGQRMLLMLMHLAGLVLALLAPGVIGAGVFLGAKFFVGWTIALPVAAVLAALALGFECAFGLKLLGRRFERMDLTE